MERREILWLVAKLFMATNQMLGFQLLPVDPKWRANTQLVPLYIRPERDRNYYNN